MKYETSLAAIYDFKQYFDLFLLDVSVFKNVTGWYKQEPSWLQVHPEY